ncbi:hypothetical protein ACVIM8_001644 [Bradyrhizobium sp. USDA 4529]
MLGNHLPAARCGRPSQKLAGCAYQAAWNDSLILKTRFFAQKVVHTGQIVATYPIEVKSYSQLLRDTISSR